MRMTIALLAALLLCACGGSGEKPEPTGESEAAAEATAEAETAVDASPVDVELASRNVSCGCVVEHIGTCGNYIEIDGAYVPIANSDDHGLGEMEWCGQEGVTAEAAGQLVTGEFHAETLLVQASE